MTLLGIIERIRDLKIKEMIIKLDLCLLDQNLSLFLMSYLDLLRIMMRFLNSYKG